MRLCVCAHSLLQEHLVSAQMVGAEQTPQDADGGLKQVHVHVLVEGQLSVHPFPGLRKLCRRRVSTHCLLTSKHW